MRLPGAGLVGENPPHLPRAQGKKMRAVLPVNQLQIGEAQVKLIDQRRGLQSMAVTFPCHAALRCPMQLPVNLRSELLQSTFIALAPCLKQFGDLVSEGLIHPKASAPQAEVQGRSQETLAHRSQSFGPVSGGRIASFLRYRFSPQFSL